MYEKVSLENAIGQMDDMGFCPIESCKQLAHIDKNSNSGLCSFCNFRYCLDCKAQYHPNKRCGIHRIDKLERLNEETKVKVEDLIAQNENSAEILSKLYMKIHTKRCPNGKCSVPIVKEESGCTHIQCTRCFTWICWKCGMAAKG